MNEKLSVKIMYCEEKNYIMYISVYLVDDVEKQSDTRIVDVNEKREIELDDIWQFNWQEISC